MDVLAQDFRYAVRSLRRMPSFTAIVALTLALGIGASTAVFSVVNGVLLRPLPYERPDDVLLIHTRIDGTPGYELSLPEYWDLRERTRSFGALSAFADGSLILTGTGEPERLGAGYVTADGFRLLGVAPVKGRTFSQEEDLPGRATVVLLSDGLWRRRFGADPDIVGRTLRLDDTPTTVLGVMPAGFQLPTHYAGGGMELWTLLQLDPAIDRTERGWHWLSVMGRLRPGVDADGADRETASLLADMRRSYPHEYDDAFSGSATPAEREVVGDIRPVLLVLMGAVGS